MDIEFLRTLPAADQQVFLLGRIASEASRLDAAARTLHAALRGDHNVNAFLDSPKHWRDLTGGLKKLLQSHPSLDARTTDAAIAAIAAAEAAWARRNRYTHDFLRANGPHGWELAQVTRGSNGEQALFAVSFEHMVALVQDIIAATWTLRGCAVYVLSQDWEEIAFGHVTGMWDGSASFVL